MEVLKGIPIPIIADGVLSPQVHYGESYLDEPHTGIYFITSDEQHGRIIFENLDAIKVCRGEMMPYKYDWDKHVQGTWIFKVENSLWQKERFDYENKFYGQHYEFGGNVNDMLTDFSHYLFSFHDQFVEVIARGFWFEKDKESLFGKPLQEGHPFLNLPVDNYEILESNNLRMQVRKNPKPENQLKKDAEYCSQKLMEFALELEGTAKVDNTLLLFYRDGKLLSSLKGYFGKEKFTKEGIATLDDVLPYLGRYAGEVYERRKKMGKEE
ncbi:MAG: hypothetical protein ACK5KL_13690 [Dysgonomonas sp.]